MVEAGITVCRDADSQARPSSYDVAKATRGWGFKNFWPEAPHQTKKIKRKGNGGTGMAENQSSPIHHLPTFCDNGVEEYSLSIDARILIWLQRCYLNDRRLCLP